jgi:hypothetical protein
LTFDRPLRPNRSAGRVSSVASLAPSAAPSYPTRTTDNTFTLVVTDGQQSSKIYEAPGDFSSGSYNPQYTYVYDVLFNDGKRFKSDPITTTDTLINLTPNNFGTRQVTFIGQDVPFGGAAGVKVVNIDFFFAPPVGNSALEPRRSDREHQYHCLSGRGRL